MKVILVMALTLDGKIGKNRDHFPDWTGSADKRLFARISKKAGVVIMGSKTFDTFGSPLPGRKNVILTRNQNRRSEWDNLIYTGDPPKKILEDLEAEGFSEAVLAGGALVNSLYAKENLIDEIVVTISPLVFGVGLSLFTEAVRMTLALEEIEKVDDNLVCLRYRVVK
jgi:dihydrofolate reductase